MSNNKSLREKLQEPFNADEIEWRVQSQGKQKTGGKIWCTVLAYVDARALQNRLDDVFDVMGWSDSYEPLGDDFICTLTVNIDGKEISKQNGASKTQVEGFKGGISNSFKRVCASGFGIGRYLYDLDVTFAETTYENMSNNSEWKRGSFKDKETNKYITYFWKIPKLPMRYLKAVDTITQEQARELRSVAKVKGQTVSLVLQRFKISRLGELTTESYKQIMSEWERL